jgi:hypothetical protein
MTETMTKIAVRRDEPPAELLRALEAKRIGGPVVATEMLTLYHVCWFDINSFCGVVGDGLNASYEWFIWRNGALDTSDIGYGIIEAALRDVLNKAVPK